MPEHSRLVRMRIINLGCIGPDGIEISLNDIICLVGPNNAGKSTVLRAYEAAIGNLDLTEREICSASTGLPASVEIWVHVPEGVENIDEKWKVVEGDLLLLRSKWEWKQPGKPVRTTWDPVANDYAIDGKASGIDAVFSSRMPQPLRIHALEAPKGEHDTLLKLVLDPIVRELNKLISEEDSDLRKAIVAVTTAAKVPVAEFALKIEDVKKKVNQSYQKIFPHSEIHLNVSISDIDVKPLDLLVKSSQFEVVEKGAQAGWHQQGTGSQRALFWSMLEIRSELKKAADHAQLKAKRVADISKQLAKLQIEIGKAKKPETAKAKAEELEKLTAELAALTDKETATEIDVSESRLSLPGYMLLIDEPEIALHPNAVRAAKAHLYELARESGWQIMLSTHSPTFIDPLEDHTTIVRLVRTNNHPSPKTYRSDSIIFSMQERENLKMLLLFDQAISEMFFGAYPIIIEGDTEYAAFSKTMMAYSDEFPVEGRPLLIRARGKEIIPAIVRILTQFKVNFAVLHDADSPRTKDGRTKNSSWSANHRISEVVRHARIAGLRVVHRVAIPDFERQHKLPEGTSMKPYEIWTAIASKPTIAASVKALLQSLCSTDAPQEPYQGVFTDNLIEAVKVWSSEFASDDPRFDFSESQDKPDLDTVVV